MEMFQGVLFQLAFHQNPIFVKKIGNSIQTTFKSVCQRNKNSGRHIIEFLAKVLFAYISCLRSAYLFCEEISLEILSQLNNILHLLNSMAHSVYTPIASDCHVAEIDAIAIK